MTWCPIDLEALQRSIRLSEQAMDPAAIRLWRFIRIVPIKWQQHPWGDEGGGFWVVGIFGNCVLWYNDIEDGFNVSRYTHCGTISEYLCNQDELHRAISLIQHTLETG